MIPMTEACARLASVSEALAQADQKLVADWEPEEPPPTVRLAGFARALAQDWSNIPEYVRAEVLDVVETLLLIGNDLVQTAVATGFLERLLNAALDGTLDRKTLEAMLGPASLEYFNNWDQASRAKSSAPAPTLERSHTQKAKDGVRLLEKWLRENPTARPGDRAAAENMIQQLQQALEE